MPGEIIPLIDVLVEIPDFRKSRGLRHPLVAILAMVSAAMLCGYRSYGAMAEWGRNYGDELVAALGFTRPETPCAATLHTILRHIDIEVFETKLSWWVHQVRLALGLTPADQEGVAIDGKILRSSHKQGAPGAHLFSAVSHLLGLTVAQHAIAQGNEIAAALEVLTHIMLHGRVITMDALLTQRAVAQAIVERGGDYVMMVKKNQCQVYQDIETLFQAAEPVGEPIAVAPAPELGHGRIELRSLTSSQALVEYTAWPALQQVFRIERSVIVKKTDQQRQEVTYGITSLTPEKADAATLLRFVRHHWCIENKSHWVRDVTFDEDRCRVRSGNIPHMMAALRNTAIALIRLAGHQNVASACRYYAARPWDALALLGIFPKTE